MKTQWQLASHGYNIYEDLAATARHESLVAAECRLLEDSVAAWRLCSLVATECRLLRGPAAVEWHISLEAAECMVWHRNILRTQAMARLGWGAILLPLSMLSLVL